MGRGVLAVVVVGVLALVAVAAVGCGKKQPAQGAGATAPAEQTAGQKLAAEKDKLVSAANDTLNKLQQEVQKLQAQVEAKGQQAKADYEEKIKPELDKKVADAKASLQSAKEAGAGAWSSARDKVNKALQDLQDAYQSAKQKLAPAPEQQPAQDGSPSR